MILIFGNCQGESLHRAFKGLGIESIAHWLANGETIGSDPEIILDLKIKLQQFQLEACLNGRDPLVQSELFSEGVKPSAIIFTMFHEEAPLWRHRNTGAIVYMDGSVRKCAGFNSYLDENFEVFISSGSYFERWIRAYHRARHKFPETPIFLISRVSSRFFDSPLHSLSYLQDWPGIEVSFTSTLQKVVGNDRNFHVVSLEDQIRKLGARGVDSDAIAPYLRSLGSRRDLFYRLLGRFYSGSLIRDIEHLSPRLWRAVAMEIINLLGIEVDLDADSEESPIDEKANWKDRAQRLATSGCPFDLAYVLHREIKSQRLADWSFMGNAGAKCPPAKYVLSMLRILKTLGKSQPISDWVQAHEEFQMPEIHNLGEEFEARYCKSLTALK